MLDLPEQTLFTPRAWQATASPGSPNSSRSSKPKLQSPARESVGTGAGRSSSWLGGSRRPGQCVRPRKALAAAGAEGAEGGQRCARTALGLAEPAQVCARSLVGAHSTDPLRRFAPPRRPRQWPNLPDSANSPQLPAAAGGPGLPTVAAAEVGHAPRSPRERDGGWGPGGAGLATPTSLPATRTAPGAWSVRSSARCARSCACAGRTPRPFQRLDADRDGAITPGAAFAGPVAGPRRGRGRESPAPAAAPVGSGPWSGEEDEGDEDVAAALGCSWDPASSGPGLAGLPGDSGTRSVHPQAVWFEGGRWWWCFLFFPGPCRFSPYLRRQTPWILPSLSPCIDSL